VQRASTPGDAVHPDAFAGTAAGRPDQGDLDRVALLRSRFRTAHARLDTRQLLPPADDLALGRRAVAAAPGQQDDRLEQARLACGVGTPDELRAWFEDGVDRGIPAKIADGDTPQDRGVGRGAGEAGLQVRQEVVRTGITTWM